MLTTSEVIEYMGLLQAASYPTIDHFLNRRWGMDYKEDPLYPEMKEALEATMVLEEVQYPGYISYEWQDR